jgi:hypothetical protein
VLEGSLNDFSLPDIFQLIALTKKTGALTVTSEGREGKVLFRGGEVCFAVSDVQRVALGARLVAAGLVGEDQVTRVLERKRDEGGDVVALLLDEAALDEDAVDAFLRGQIEDAVFDLMCLGTAGFRFDATEEDAGGGGLTMSTEQLIMEGGRRMGEWAGIREQIPAADAVLVLSPAPAAEDGTVSVGVAEWGLLALVDGRRTVRDIVELTGKGEFTTTKLLAELAERGFVHVASAEDDAGGALAEMVARREMLQRLEELELGETPSRSRAASNAEDTPRDDAPSMPAAPPQAPEGDAGPLDGSDEGPEPAAGDALAEELGSFDLGAALPAAPEAADHSDGEQAGDLGGADVKAAAGLNGAEHPEGDKQARPLTRDEDVNKGLLLRLIDGVREA